MMAVSSAILEIYQRAWLCRRNGGKSEERCCKLGIRVMIYLEFQLKMSGINMFRLSRFITATVRLSFPRNANAGLF